MNRRFLRIGFLVFCDMALVVLSYFLSFWLRIDLLESQSQSIYDTHYILNTLPWLLLTRIVCNTLFRLYNWSFSHASLNEGVRLAGSLLLGALVFVVFGHVLQMFDVPPPRSVYVLETALTFLGMFTLRFFPGYLLLLSAQHLQVQAADNNEVLRTVIYGRDGAGEAIARELLRTHGHGCAVIGFIDDNPAHLNSSVHGIKVLGNRADLPAVIEHNGIEQFLLAGDELSGQEMRDLVDICGPRRVRLKSIPVYRSLLQSSGVIPETCGVSGNVNPNSEARTRVTGSKNRIIRALQYTRSIENIDPEMLLDRQPVDFSPVDMRGFLQGKTVMVTGAAGSIGSELCRQVAGYGVDRLLLFDINENALFFLEMELRETYPECDSVLVLGSIRDRSRLNEVMERYHPQIVFHAAAHKHVPILENAPDEALKNNILGTYETAECACESGVEHFVLVSTDKAVARTNVLGISKWLAELTVRSLNRRRKTRFQIVRFGNVLDSNGSLVEVIRRQIAKGGPVTITHPDMERFFMTIREAVGLVLVAAALGEGETNVLDMGDPVKVDTLVRQMIYLSGFVPEQDITVCYTTPRPGERLTEMLYHQQAKLYRSSFPRINIVDEEADYDIEAMLAKAREVRTRKEVGMFFTMWSER